MCFTLMLYSQLFSGFVLLLLKTCLLYNNYLLIGNFFKHIFLLLHKYELFSIIKIHFKNFPVGHYFEYIGTNLFQRNCIEFALNAKPVRRYIPKVITVQTTRKYTLQESTHYKKVHTTRKYAQPVLCTFDI